MNKNCFQNQSPVRLLSNCLPFTFRISAAASSTRLQTIVANHVHGSLVRIDLLSVPHERDAMFPQFNRRPLTVSGARRATPAPLCVCKGAGWECFAAPAFDNQQQRTASSVQFRPSAPPLHSLHCRRTSYAKPRFYQVACDGAHSCRSRLPAEPFPQARHRGCSLVLCRWLDREL